MRHAIRACKSRVINKIFNTNAEGKRKNGRQKLRWRYEVSQNISTLGIKNWKNLVMNRKNGEIL